MRSAVKLNPTLAGSFAVLVWGLALPIARYIENQIGVLAYIGLLFTGTACLGFIHHWYRGEPLIPKAALKNRVLYLRWLLFVLNMPCAMGAVFLVQNKYVPVVILLNYLWPTLTILFSIVLSGIVIKNRIVFTLGLMVVLTALSIEILQPNTLSTDIFSLPSDCLAYFLAIMAASCWGLYSAISKRYAHETGGGAILPLFQSSLVLALPLSLLPNQGTWSHFDLGLAAAIILWCFAQFVAFLTWDFGMRRGNIVLLSLGADFIPWLSLTTTQLLLGIDIGEKTALSALLLVIGAITVRYGTAAR